MRYAAVEGRRQQTPVEIVHVTRENGPRAEEAGQRVLAAAVAAVPELAGAPTHLLAGAAGPALVRASGRARLLVLGPRGTHDTGLLGSVAREVLHRGACPTVFVHGRAIPAQRITSGTTRSRNALST